MGCSNSFWSFFNSESGVNILGTGKLLLGGYFNSLISGVTFTPEKEFFKLFFGVKITLKWGYFYSLHFLLFLELIQL